MINCRAYISGREIVGFDKYTAEFSDGGQYIFAMGEYLEFMSVYSDFCDYEEDSSGMAPLYERGKFKFTDCRR